MGSVQQGGVGKVGTSQFIGRTKWARAYYDFAVDGGLVSAITLRGDALPSGAIVLGTYVKVDTIVTGGAGATVSLGIETAADLRAAATLATGPVLNATGTLKLLVTGGTDPLVTTAVRSVVATVAVNALTAGKFSVLVAYIEVT